MIRSMKAIALLHTLLIESQLELCPLPRSNLRCGSKLHVPFCLEKSLQYFPSQRSLTILWFVSGYLLFNKLFSKSNSDQNFTSWYVSVNNICNCLRNIWIPRQLVFKTIVLWRLKSRSIEKICKEQIADRLPATSLMKNLKQTRKWQHVVIMK